MTDTAFTTPLIQGSCFLHPSQLHESPVNPRTISVADFERLCRDLEDDPQMLEARPILATDDGEIAGGNMRHRAAASMLEVGPEKYPKFCAFVNEKGGIPTFVAPMDEKLKRKRMTRDNNGYGDYVKDDLSAFIREYATDYDGDVADLGFRQDELDQLLKDDERPDGDGDADQDPPPPDLWGVIVECSDEQAQAELLERLDAEGYTVRALL